MVLVALVTLAMLGASATAASGAPVWHAQMLAFPTNFMSPGASGEVQNVAVKATGGSFTLTFEGQTTLPIAAVNGSQSALAVQSALEALSTVGHGNVTVTSPSSGELKEQYVVRFGGTLDGPWPQMTASIAPPGTVTVALASSDAYQVAVENLGDATSGGTITVVDHLPRGVETTQTPQTEYGHNEWTCSEGAGQTVVTCESTATVGAAAAYYNHASPGPGSPGVSLEPITIPVAVAPGGAEVITNSATVSGGGAVDPATSSIVNPVEAPAQTFGISSLSFDAIGAHGGPFTQAGGHPYAVTTDLQLNQAPGGLDAPYYVDGYLGEPGGDEPRTVLADLPLGLIGDPQAAPKCSTRQFTEGPNHGNESGGDNTTACPANTRVGVVFLTRSHSVTFAGPYQLFNLVPDPGHAAEFGIHVNSFAIVLYGDVVRSHGAYVLRVSALVPQAEVMAFSVTFFGDPAAAFATGEKETPFLTNPVDCAAGGEARTLGLHADSWSAPGAGDPFKPDFSDPNWLPAATTLPPVEECDALTFSPSLSFQPAAPAEGGTSQVDEPSGYDINLEVPQTEAFSELATPELRTATVALPEGLSVSPSAANGLQACSDAQIALESNEPGSCPLASQIATVKVTTPLLEVPLEGQVFLGQPQCSPCSEADASEGHIFRLFIQVHSQALGVTIKLSGTVSANPATGQLTATFKENPQLPFGDLELKFTNGPRAPLANPQSCGTFTTVSELEPWSAPQTPTKVSQSQFTITGCPSSTPFAPAFAAGTISPAAGAYSPLAVTFARSDGEQDLSGIKVNTPPGLLGKIAGIPRCSEVEANAGTCGPDSQIGTTTVTAGSGSDPYTVSGGRVYLTGPYESQPFGLSIVVPAVAGPFNLGDVVVRASIHVDPRTAALTITSDPLPQIRDGVPFRLRTVTVEANRLGFTLNATNCARQQITAALTGTQGASASPSSPYAASGCANLPFKPSFAASTRGATSRANGASLDVRVAQKAGEANIHKVAVRLPKGLPARLSTLKLACSEAQFAANPAGCPAGSFVGAASAATPLLGAPLSGPAIFVSHGGAAFPDLDVVLQGEGVTLYLVGHTEIKNGLTYSRFETVPDAPIQSFELKLPEGPHSALAAPGGSLCRKSLAMPTTITGQNGAVVTQPTKIAVTGCRASKSLTRAQKLARARKACKQMYKRGEKRAACLRRANKRYGPKAKSKRSATRSTNGRGSRR